MIVPRCCILAAAVVIVAPAFAPNTAHQATAEMARAATAFVASLTDEQRAKAQFDFGDAERLNWHFVPRARRGLPLKEMTPPQRERARALLQAGLSQRGYLKASTIMELDLVLREMG